MLNLLDEIDAGRLAAEVCIVIASRNCAGLDRSKAAGLNAQLVPFKDYAKAGQSGLVEYSDRITALLDDAGVGLVLMAGFLSKWIIPDHYAGRVMNIHPALLPKFGGKGMFGHHVHEAVLAAGETESGCSVHFVNNEYDAGPVILQKKIPVKPTDNPDTLAGRVFEVECAAYPQAIRLFAAGKLQVDSNSVNIL